MILKVKFSELSKKLDIKFTSLAQSFTAEFGEIQEVTKYIGGEKYAGDYVVTPRVDAQMMPTKNKTMMDDVTIKAIPVYDVSNNAGGTTFYIATMDEAPDGGKAILGKLKLGTSVL